MTQLPLILVLSSLELIQDGFHYYMKPRGPGDPPKKISMVRQDLLRRKPYARPGITLNLLPRAYVFTLNKRYVYLTVTGSDKGVPQSDLRKPIVQSCHGDPAIVERRNYNR